MALEHTPNEKTAAPTGEGPGTVGLPAATLGGALWTSLVAATSVVVLSIVEAQGFAMVAAAATLVRRTAATWGLLPGFGMEGGAATSVLQIAVKGVGAETLAHRPYFVMVVVDIVASLVEVY